MSDRITDRVPDEYDALQAAILVLHSVRSEVIGLKVAHDAWKDLALRYQAKAEAQQLSRGRTIRLNRIYFTQSALSIIQRAYRHTGTIDWHVLRTPINFERARAGKSLQHIHRQHGLGRFRR